MQSVRFGKASRAGLKCADPNDLAARRRRQRLLVVRSDSEKSSNIPIFEYIGENALTRECSTYGVKKQSYDYYYNARVLFYYIIYIMHITQIFLAVSTRVHHACVKWALVSDFVVGKPTDSYYRRDRRRKERERHKERGI